MLTDTLTRTHAPEKMIESIIKWSIYIAIILSCLFALYEPVFSMQFRTRFWVALASLCFLLLLKQMLQKGYFKLTHWSVIGLYEILTAGILIHWGFSSVIGILFASFVILLPSLLMTPKNILFVTIITFLILLSAYFIHDYTPIAPTVYVSTTPSNFIDVITVLSILGIFAFVSWASASRALAILKRALQAEAKLHAQKNMLAIELEKESTKLRKSQLEQIEQLHHFAIIGQSATATLHELSNHLSILNLDIDDLKQHHKHSKAIANAEEGIRNINNMVQKARTHLNVKRQPHLFNAHTVLSRAIKDVHPKFTQNHIKLTKSYNKNSRNFLIYGDPINLMQCVSILLNNAHEACANVSQARVRITITVDTSLTVTIADNGPGVPENLKKKLFRPLESTKADGLGVGLYITKMMVESQFKGTLELLNTKKGASFKITLPRYQSNMSQPS